jgi:3-hydroxyisobutyrate dehydrogenase
MVPGNCAAGTGWMLISGDRGRHDVGRLAAAVGIDMKDAFSLFEHFNPGQTLPQRAKRISAGQYTPPSFEMSMARKDLRLTVDAGRARRARAGDGAGAGEAAG